MPFLQEGANGGGNVTITPTPLSLCDLKNVIAGTPRTQSNSNRVQKILPREPVPFNAQRKSFGEKSLALAQAAMNNFQTEREPLYVSSRRARSNNFTLKETFDLLKVWASGEMQWQMKHNFRNFRVWEAISYSMSELGHDRTAIQCKNRIQNLTSIFYRIKKSKQDHRAFNFPYFKLIQDVLEGKKSGSLGALGLHPPSVNAFGQGLNPKDFQPQSPTHPQQGFAAHLALVEEYQHLINGQSESFSTAPSSQTTDGVSVLSPEVSLSEGNSPIQVENQGGSDGGMRNGTPPKVEDKEDGVLGEDEGSEFEEPLQDDDEHSDAMDSLTGGSRGEKRGFSYGRGSGLPLKRGRGLSGTSEGSVSDPLSHYLSEMVDIERQWLDMERERAENERQMMVYMMQILQALVAPQTPPREEEEPEEEDKEEKAEENGH